MCAFSEEDAGPAREEFIMADEGVVLGDPFTVAFAFAGICVVCISMLLSTYMDQIYRIMDQWLIWINEEVLLRALFTELVVQAVFLLPLYYGQNYLAPETIVSTMLPCFLMNEQMEKEIVNVDANFTYWTLDACAYGSSYPIAKVPLVTLDVKHQLDKFLLFFVSVHVGCVFLTITLGKAKIRGWKEWEKEMLFPSSEFCSDLMRFRLPYERTFLKMHTIFWNKNAIMFYLESFFNKVFKSLTKREYLTMRHGFLTGHLAPGSEFNFHVYINRSLEADFEVLIGDSPMFLASRVLLVLLNVTGSQLLLWFSQIPLCTILAVCTMLEAIIAKMVLEIQVKHKIVQGVPSVLHHHQHFWFGCPYLVLVLIHFMIFQNAFQMSRYIWIWYEFGLKSNFHNRFKLITIRLFLGIAVQVLCGYIALPLYVLVSQMGSRTKKYILKDVLNSKETF